MENLVSIVKSRQRAWAGSRGIEIDKDGYCYDRNANFYEPLSACSCRELESGDGSELGKAGRRGKIQALHSSAALACNFFDYWRGRDLGPLAQSLDIPTRLCGLALEQKFATGLGRIAPNLDVVLYGCDGTVFAIESKFTESFARSKNKCFLKPKYFPEAHGLWKDAGLPGCQTLAEDLHNGRERFELLDAAQLLKHMLGLSLSGQPWKLTCLWYGPSGPMADLHAKELATFSERIGSDSTRFATLTYQDLFERMSIAVKDEHNAWRSYMWERYFCSTSNPKPE